MRRARTSSPGSSRHPRRLTAIGLSASEVDRRIVAAVCTSGPSPGNHPLADQPYSARSSTARSTERPAPTSSDSWKSTKTRRSPVDGIPMGTGEGSCCEPARSTGRVSRRSVPTSGSCRSNRFGSSVIVAEMRLNAHALHSLAHPHALPGRACMSVNVGTRSTSQERPLVSEATRFVLAPHSPSAPSPRTARIGGRYRPLGGRTRTCNDVRTNAHLNLATVCRYSTRCLNHATSFLARAWPG